MPLLLNLNGEYFDPIMGMTVPTGSTPGDLYAQDITNDLIQRIAPHTHTGANNLDGYQLDADGLNLTLDINFNSTNLDNVRAVRFISLDSPASSPQDVNSLYDVSGDIWANDGAGNHIQLTKNGQVNIGSFQKTVSFSVLTVTDTNYNILFNDPYTMFQCDTTGSSFTIQLPIAATVPQGRFYYFLDAGFFCATNNITVEVAIGSGNFIIFNGASSTTFNMVDNGMSLLLYSDGAQNWYAITFDQLTFNGINESLTLNGANLTVNNANVTVTGNTSLTGNFNQTNVSGVDSVMTNTVLDISGGLVNINSNVSLNTINFSGAINFGRGGLIAQGGIFAFNGANLQAQSASAISSEIAQGIIADTAYGITSGVVGGIASGVDQGIQLNGTAADTIGFGTVHSYTKTYPIVVGALTTSAIGTLEWKQATAIGTFAYGLLGLTSNMAQIIPLTNLHNGAKISQITVHMYVGQEHTTPLNPFTVDLVSMTVADGTALPSSAFISLGTGPQAATGINYNNITTMQSFTYVPRDNVLNTATLMYAILLTDETGVDAKTDNLYVAYTITYINIHNMNFA